MLYSGKHDGKTELADMLDIIFFFFFFAEATDSSVTLHYRITF